MIKPKVINLLPTTQQREIRLERHASVLKTFMIWLFVSMIVYFALSLVSEIFTRSTIASVDTRIVRLESELKTAANQKLEDEVLALNNQIKLVQNLRSQHYYWSNSLIELGNILPDDLHVDFLIMDRATGKVEIAGQAGSRASVLQFWANIKRSNYFKDINFPLTNLEKERNGSFTYTFYVKPEKVKTE